MASGTAKTTTPTNMESSSHLMPDEVELKTIFVSFFSLFQTYEYLGCFTYFHMRFRKIKSNIPIMTRDRLQSQFVPNKPEALCTRFGFGMLLENRKTQQSNRSKTFSFASKNQRNLRES